MVGGGDGKMGPNLRGRSVPALVAFLLALSGPAAGAAALLPSGSVPMPGLETGDADASSAWTAAQRAAVEQLRSAGSPLLPDGQGLPLEALTAGLAGMEAASAEEVEGRYVADAAFPGITLRPTLYHGAPNWWSAPFAVDPTGRGGEGFVVASWDGVFEMYDTGGRLHWSVDHEDLAPLVENYAYNQTMIAAGPWGFGLPVTMTLPLRVAREGQADLFVVSLLVAQRDPARLSTFVAFLDTASGAVVWSDTFAGVVRGGADAGGGRVALAVETGPVYSAGRAAVGDDGSSRVEVRDGATGGLLAQHDAGGGWAGIWGLDVVATPEGDRLVFAAAGPAQHFVSSGFSYPPGASFRLVVLGLGEDSLKVVAERAMPAAPILVDADEHGVLWRGVERRGEQERWIRIGALGLDGQVRWEVERRADFFAPTMAIGDLDGDGVRDVAAITYRAVGSDLVGSATDALTVPLLQEGGAGNLLVASGASGDLLEDRGVPFSGLAYVPGPRPLLALVGDGRVQGVQPGAGREPLWELESAASTYHVPVLRSPEGPSLLALGAWGRPEVTLIDAAQGVRVASHPTSDLVFAVVPFDMEAFEGQELVVGGLRGDVSLLTASGARAWRVHLDSAVRSLEPSGRAGLLLAATDHQVYGIDADRGRVVWEGPRQTPAGTQWYASEFVDLNGDGVRDAVLSEVGFTPPDVRWLTAVDGATGAALWQMPALGNRGGVAMDARDLNGDGVPDVVVGYRYDIGKFGTIHAHDGRDGSVLWTRVADQQSSINARQHSVRIVDFDGDDRPEVAVLTWDSHYYVLEGDSGALRSYPALPDFEPILYDALAVPKGLQADSDAEELAVLGRMSGHMWGAVTAVDAEGNAGWFFRSPIAAFTYNLAAGDLDGDRFVDLAVGSGDGVYGILGKRVASFEPGLDLLWNRGSASRIWMVDVDRDGRDDVVFAQERTLVPAPVFVFATIDLRTTKGLGVLEYDPEGPQAELSGGDLGQRQPSPMMGLVAVLAVLGVAVAWRRRGA